jgi:hypothetical protein
MVGAEGLIFNSSVAKNVVSALLEFSIFVADAPKCVIYCSLGIKKEQNKNVYLHALQKSVFVTLATRFLSVKSIETEFFKYWFRVKTIMKCSSIFNPSGRAV